MPIISSAQVTRVFSLCCTGCDAGGDIETPEQAIAQGWSDIDEDFDGRSWNYLGTCPDCRAEDDSSYIAPQPTAAEKGEV